MEGSMLITPGQASEILAVSTSTLRRWAARYAQHLTREHTEGAKRLYTQTDINTLTRIRDLSAQKYSQADIDELLGLELADDKGKALIRLTDFIDAIEDSRKKSAELQTQIDDTTKALIDKIKIQQQQIDDLKEWVNTPWYKRKRKQ